MIIKLSEKHPTYNLLQAQKVLTRKNVHMSLKMIECRLRSSDYGWRSRALKPEYIEKRLGWANENIERDWSNVVFTSESSFWTWVRTPRA